MCGSFLDCPPLPTLYNSVFEPCFYHFFCMCLTPESTLLFLSSLFFHILILPLLYIWYSFFLPGLFYLPFTLCSVQLSLFDFFPG